MPRPRKIPTGTWDQYRLFVPDETRRYLEVYRKHGLRVSEDSITAWIRMIQMVTS